MLDREERFILGARIDLTHPDSEKNYKNALEEARLLNKAWGYGTDKKDPEQKKYEEKRKKLKQLTYIRALEQKRS